MGKIPFLRTSLISPTFDRGSEASGLLGTRVPWFLALLQICIFGGEPMPILEGNGKNSISSYFANFPYF